MKISSLNNYQKRQISFWQLILYCVGGDLLQNALINGLFSNFAQIVYFPSDDCACVCFYAEHRCVSNDQRPSVALQNRDESGRKIDQNKSTPHLSLPHSHGSVSRSSRQIVNQQKAIWVPSQHTTQQIVCGRPYCRLTFTNRGGTVEPRWFDTFHRSRLFSSKTNICEWQLCENLWKKQLSNQRGSTAQKRTTAAPKIGSFCSHEWQRKRS